MTKKTLITSALPYANGVIHFGHLAGNNLPADVYARFCRMRGDEVLFLCGSDEYGMAVSLSAQLAGRSPQDHVNHYHELNKRLFQRMNMSWDHYSRTTWPGHIQPVQQFFLDLLKNGYIEEKWSDQLYSQSEDRFLSDRYVVGTCPSCGFETARGDECPRCAASYEATDLKNPRSKITDAALEKRSTKHWFLRLDLFKEPLLKWLETKEWKPNVMNFIKAYIADLRPRCITRDSDWGVPVPLEGAIGKVLYVWFDAPIGYITAAMEWSQLKGDPEAWKSFWLNENTNLVQFMGKDNITFHAVIFPAMIMGQDLSIKLVDAMPANEFYNLESRKLSKSDGWSVDLDEFLNRYDSEALRYMISATAPESSDSEFTWKEFQSRVNADLVGKWGNFIHRTLTFIQKMQGQVPPAHSQMDEDKLFESQLLGKVQEIENCYSEFKLRRATQLIMEMAQICNTYFDAQKPWAFLKQMEQVRLEAVMYSCLKAIQYLAVATHPIMPVKTQRVWQLLGFQGHLDRSTWQESLQRNLPVGITLPISQPLFAKIEDEQVAVEVASLQESAKKNSSLSICKALCEPFLSMPCSMEDFLQIDIRCGQILEAHAVPKSSKLLKLSIDLGQGHPRQIISGIAMHYKPEDLVGKKVLCLANLPKAKLMGLESEGMLLSAGDGKLLELPILQHVMVGARLR